jgi:hypothetical protein
MIVAKIKKQNGVTELQVLRGTMVQQVIRESADSVDLWLTQAAYDAGMLPWVTRSAGSSRYTINSTLETIPAQKIEQANVGVTK